MNFYLKTTNQLTLPITYMWQYSKYLTIIGKEREILSLSPQISL